MLTNDKVFLETLQKFDPSLITALGEFAPPNLVFSSAKITLSSSHWTMVKDFIQDVHAMSRETGYRNYVAKSHPHLFASSCKNESVLMSYDFHITSSGPKLIEINTNASLSTYASIWTEAHLPGQGFPKLVRFLDTFEEEAALQNVSLNDGVFICDQNPLGQRAYGEFLIYEALLKGRGYPCKIVDISEISYDEQTRSWRDKSGQSARTIYNRWTDFYLTEPVSLQIRRGWEAGLLLTPQPVEYGLLADKQRMLDWCTEEFRVLMSSQTQRLKRLQNLLPTTVPIRSFDRTMGRQERSKWFFKPRSSFGSRGVYEGSKITNKAFEEILLKDYIAQEFVPPPTVSIETSNGPKDFKWDLRVYSYRSEAILPIARFYVGQTTNSQTEGGGLGPVCISIGD